MNVIRRACELEGKTCLLYFLICLARSLSYRSDDTKIEKSIKR